LLEQLDLLLIEVVRPRKIRRDGIHFQGFRYLSLTLAAYVGEDVTIRHDPRDMAEIRVFYQDRFLCRAISAEMAGETIALRDIIRVRNRRRRELRSILDSRQKTVDALLQLKKGQSIERTRVSAPATEPATKIKALQKRVMPGLSRLRNTANLLSSATLVRPTGISACATGHLV
jgi:putative transposase